MHNDNVGYESIMLIAVPVSLKRLKERHCNFGSLGKDADILLQSMLFREKRDDNLNKMK